MKASDKFVSHGKIYPEDAKKLECYWRLNQNVLKVHIQHEAIKLNSFNKLTAGEFYFLLLVCVQLVSSTASI